MHVAWIWFLAACDGQDSRPDDEVSCNSIAQWQSDDPSGLEECDGSVNRVDALACVGDPYAAVEDCPKAGGCNPHGGGECAAGTVCGLAPGGSWNLGCVCLPVCGSDSDCAADQACLCASERAATSNMDLCVTAYCRTGADCHSGECGASPSPCGDLFGFYCRSDLDDCRVDSDCGSKQQLCAFDTGKGRWACVARASCD